MSRSVDRLLSVLAVVPVASLVLVGLRHYFRPTKAPGVRPKPVAEASVLVPHPFVRDVAKAEFAEVVERLPAVSVVKLGQTVPLCLELP